jgi:hypothetical protein
MTNKSKRCESDENNKKDFAKSNGLSDSDYAFLYTVFRGVAGCRYILY